jgi:hypothetical protein
MSERAFVSVNWERIEIRGGNKCGDSSAAPQNDRIENPWLTSAV